MEERVARVREIRQLADDVWAVDLEAVEPPVVRFRGGQFISLRIGDGYHPRRSYSLASSPLVTDGFSLVVKNIGESAKGFFSRLGPGDPVTYTGPMGFFTLVEPPTPRVVMAATGVGISAILAQLHQLLSGTEVERVDLFWGFNDPGEVFGRELIDELAGDPRFHCHLYVAEPDADWSGEVGHVTDPVVATAGDDSPTYYLCGAGEMVMAVRRALAERGVPAERVRTEVFYPRVEPQPVHGG